MLPSPTLTEMQDIRNSKLFDHSLRSCLAGGLSEPAVVLLGFSAAAGA